MMEMTAETEQRLQRLLKEGLLILRILLCLFLVFALVSFDYHDDAWSKTGSGINNNIAGVLGAWTADILFSLIGLVAYLLPVLIATRLWLVFRSIEHGESYSIDKLVLVLRLLGMLLIIISGAAIAAYNWASVSWGGDPLPMGSGGIIGEVLSDRILSILGIYGANLFLVSVFLFGLTMYMDIAWIAVCEQLGEKTIHAYYWVKGKYVAWKRSRERLVVDTQQFDALSAVNKKVPKKREPITIEASVQKQPLSEQALKQKQIPLFTGTADEADLPQLDLLDLSQERDKKGYSAESLEVLSRQLESKLEDFGIDAKVISVLPGPVVTRFEIQPAPGLKSSRVTAIARDIARSLAVVSVRVVEVIPGKSVIGIEIPNEHREMVRLRDVLSSPQFDSEPSPLALAMGYDIAGESVIADLGKMPHVLVAGTTGSGKSVAVNVMLLSLLYKSTPAQVRLLLVDPKMLELSVYEGIPHLLAPVITDMNDAANGLHWCVGEMERRYKLMAQLGVRNLLGYNRRVQLAKEEGNPIPDPLWRPSDLELVLQQDGGELAKPPDLDTLPSIVVVIDEFADMMMIVGKKVETLIARIAQKARAAGIHLILATQRPSVDVITGLIKANIPTRVAFQVSSKIDSRTILDQGGAEQLLGNGDMLFLPSGTSVPTRVHGAFVDDHEVHKVVEDVRKRGGPNYIQGITDSELVGDIVVPGMKQEKNSDDPEDDDLYDEAVEFVCESGKASISALQRKLRIGYNRAARMIEAMEAAKVVSTMESGNRRVLVRRSSELGD